MSQKNTQKNKNGAVIVGLTGTIRAGKDSVAKSIIETLTKDGFRVSAPTFSDILGRLLVIFNLPLTRENKSKLARWLQEERAGTLSFMMRGSIDRIINACDVVIINGVRWPQDFELLQSYSPHLLVGLDAPVEDRWNRGRKSPEKPDEANITLEQFTKGEENSPNEIFVKELLRIAEHEGNLFQNPGTTDKDREVVPAIAGQIAEKIKQLLR